MKIELHEKIYVGISDEGREREMGDLGSMLGGESEEVGENERNG